MNSDLDLLKISLYKEDVLKVVNFVKWNKFFNSNILITGGLGLIGSSIVDCFIVANETKKLNLNIYIADINDALFVRKYSNFNFVHFFKYNAIDRHEFNLNFDYIIIGAGIANPSLYVQYPVDTMLSNINGLSNLLDQNKNLNTKKIIYISSSEVYGIKEQNNPFIENEFGKVDYLNVRSSYAIAKISCEMFCRSYFEQFKMPVLVVRPGHIFGPSASPSDKRLSSDFCFKAARGEELIINGSGKQIRSYCYSLDCALAFIVLLSDGVPCEAYNIGSSESTSIKVLSEYISNYASVKLSILNNENNEISNPMDNACVNINKIQSIGFKNLFSCKEGIEHTIQIIKEVYKY